MKKLLLTVFCLLTLYGRFSYACHADFMYNVTSLNPPTVSFADSSSGTSGTVTYSWNFGDGSAFGTNVTEVHQYATTGTYTACLHISDNFGCSDSICYSVIVSQPAPTISTFLMPDSNALFSCSAPAQIPYYYSFYSTGFQTMDSVLIDINFGDGIDSMFYRNVGSGSFSTTANHIYLNAGTYTGHITVTGPGGITNSYTSMSVILAASCGNISGRVYNDLNSNCLYDAGEELANIGVSLYSGTALQIWTTTDASGNYSFIVPSISTYNIHVDGFNGISGHYVPTCPQSGVISVTTVPSTGNDFAIACPGGFDLTGSISGWHFRPGDTTYACVYVYNQRCNTPNGQVQVDFPSNLTPLPDSNSSYTINGNSVTYPISSGGLYWQFCIRCAVATTAQLGDTACLGLTITPITGDSVPSNNTGSFCFYITNSFDPNEKSVTPAGVGNTGAILPNTQMTYNIEFQNTGNADALNIYILDTLSANLDPASVEIIASSHPMHWSLLTGNILRFNYDNINLSPKSVSEFASHGYVTYRINQVANLAQNTQITNTANIYFDFNPAIVTNTTMNTIDQTLAVQNVVAKNSLANIYPNPANGKCFLYFNDNHLKTISVIDLVGKEVFRTNCVSDNFILNTEKFDEGVYTIRVNENNVQSDSGKLIIVH